MSSPLTRVTYTHIYIYRYNLFRVGCASLCVTVIVCVGGGKWWGGLGLSFAPPPLSFYIETHMRTEFNENDEGCGA